MKIQCKECASYSSYNKLCIRKKLTTHAGKKRNCTLFVSLQGITVPQEKSPPTYVIKHTPSVKEYKKTIRSATPAPVSTPQLDTTSHGAGSSPMFSGDQPIQTKKKRTVRDFLHRLWRGSS